MEPNLQAHHTSQEPRGNVLLAHGYAEHQGRYHDLVQHLNNAGYDAYTYDHYGHGTAPGPRARVDVGRLITDHLRARQQVARVGRAEKTVLFGHSMGGLITAASALLNPEDIAAVVLSGPALQIANTPLPASLGHVFSQVARYLPALPTGRLDANAVSHDPQVVADYQADPLNYHGAVPLLTGATMLWHGHEVLQRADRWQHPLLVFHGDEDVLADIDGSWQLVLCAVANGVDAQLVEVEGARHEVFNEAPAAQLRAQMVEWLEQYLS